MDARGTICFGVKVDTDKLYTLMDEEKDISLSEHLESFVPWHSDNKTIFSIESAGCDGGDLDYVVAIKETVQTFYWDEFDDLKTEVLQRNTDEWTHQLKAFCEEKGIPYKSEPRWLGGAYYG